MQCAHKGSAWEHRGREERWEGRWRQECCPRVSGRNASQDPAGGQEEGDGRALASVGQGGLTTALVQPRRPQWDCCQLRGMGLLLHVSCHLFGVYPPPPKPPQIRVSLDAFLLPLSVCEAAGLPVCHLGLQATEMDMEMERQIGDRHPC